MNLAKVKSPEFLAGYAYSGIEYSCVKNTKAFKEIPEEGYKNEISLPKVWVGGNYHESISNDNFQIKMRDVIADIISAFNSTFNYAHKHFDLQVNWGQAPYEPYVAIQYHLTRALPKRMTVSQIEKELGYKVEIVSED